MRQNYQEPALTVEQRLDILSNLYDEITEAKYPLQVSICDQPIIQNARNGQTNSIYNYTLLGSDIARRTQNINLLQKLEDLYRSNIPERSDEMGETPSELRRISRYFNDNIRCFRCKKVGHDSYSCLNQFSCLYCLSTQHNSDRCPQKTVCYQCYQYGHIVNECSTPAGAFCQQCKRKHHKKCNFLTRGIDPIKQMFNTDYLYNDPKIRCIRCYAYGHMICPVSDNLKKSSTS